MTSPNGFEIGQGYLSIEARLDRAGISKIASESGKLYGDSATRAATENTDLSKGFKDDKIDRTAKAEGKRHGASFGDEAGKHAGSSFGSKFGGVLKGGLVGLAGAGVALGGLLGSSLIDGAADSIKTTKILNNQIKNLGAAGQAAFKDAFTFSTTLGKALGVDDDDINKVTAKLASFPDAFKKGALGAEGMQRSVKAAFDLQAIGIGSAESNIVGIGKAMNDPIKGMTAMAKSGVSFSAEQKKQITNYMEQGKLGEAQKVLLAGIESNAKGAAEAGASPMQRAKTAVEGFAEGMTVKAMPLIEKLANFLTDKVIPAVQKLADNYGPKIGEAFEFAGKHIGTLKILGITVGVIAGSILAYNAGVAIAAFATNAWTVATTVWSGVTKVAAAAQWLMNAALSANPIGLVVIAIAAFVAAIVIAYQKSETFRDIIQAVWSGIKTAIDFAWQWIKRIFDAWLSVMVLVYKGALTAKDFIVNAFNNIKDALGVAWTWIKDHVFTPIINYFTVTIPNGFSAGKALILAVWDALKLSFQQAWDWIKNNIFQPIINYFTVTIPNAFTNGKNLIIGVWNAIKTSLSTTWNWIKANVFDRIKEIITVTIPDAFSSGKDAIQRIWDKLKEIAAVPINFLINTVYTGGIKKLWDGLAGKVGLPNLPVVDPIKFARGGVAPGHGDGDTVPAMLTPGEGILTKQEMAKLGGPRGFQELRDSIQYFADGGIVGWAADKVRGGLFEAADAAANHFVRPLINRIPGDGMWVDSGKATANTALDKMLNWIKGDDHDHPINAGAGNLPLGSIGIIPDWVKAAKAASSFGANSGIGQWLYNQVHAAGLADSNFGTFQVRNTATGNKSMHGYGRAVDLPPSMATFNWLRSNFGSQLKELIYSPAGNSQIYNGQNHMYSGITRAMHYNHVHASYDEGGWLPPGGVAKNYGSKPEAVLTPEESSALKAGGSTRGGDTIVNVYVDHLDSYAQLESIVKGAKRTSQSRYAY